jgi:hypothetical protein
VGRVGEEKKREKMREQPTGEESGGVSNQH